MALKAELNTAVAERVLRSISPQVLAEIKAATAEAAVDAQGHAKKSINQQSGSGATYRKTSPKRTHKASAPGEPPNTDTGALVNSIFFEFSENGLAATVGSRLIYAAALEFGTRNGRIEARPFIQPAAEAVRAPYIAAVTKILKKAANRAGQSR